MRIAVKEVGKPLQIMETQEKYRSDCVKQFTGKDSIAQHVCLNDTSTLSLGVDEEGLLKNLPTNFLISMNNPHYPIQKMVGTVVFVRHNYVNPLEEEIWDFEVEDLTDEDISFIHLLLNKKHQERLKENFDDYGSNAIHFRRLI